MLIIIDPIKYKKPRIKKYPNGNWRCSTIPSNDCIYIDGTPEAAYRGWASFQNPHIIRIIPNT